MFENLLKQSTYTEADIAFVVKNIRNAPKELLVKLGLAEGEIEEPKKSTKKIK
jgi:hypothetical protein